MPSRCDTYPPIPSKRAVPNHRRIRRGAHNPPDRSCPPQGIRRRHLHVPRSGFTDLPLPEKPWPCRAAPATTTQLHQLAMPSDPPGHVPGLERAAGGQTHFVHRRLRSATGRGVSDPGSPSSGSACAGAPELCRSAHPVMPVVGSEDVGITMKNTPQPLYQALVAACLLSARIKASVATGAAHELFAAGMRSPRRMSARPGNSAWTRAGRATTAAMKNGPRHSSGRCAAPSRPLRRRSAAASRRSG